MVIDHGKIIEKRKDESMEQIAISKFKATCLALLERVKASGEPLVVTKRGEPVAMITPPPPPPKAKSAFGCMKGTIAIKGDIISPIGEDDWEALKS